MYNTTRGLYNYENIFSCLVFLVIVVSLALVVNCAIDSIVVMNTVLSIECGRARNW